MSEKEALLKEIAVLIDDKDGSVELKVMDFMSMEELNAIKEALLKRKAARKGEQEDWYDEWVKTCGKSDK
jgi:hypothetical protein